MVIIHKGIPMESTKTIEYMNEIFSERDSQQYL